MNQRERRDSTDSSQREHGIEFEGPGEERSSKRPFQLALEVEELRSLAAKLNASAIIPLRFTRDSAFKPASFPDPQIPSDRRQSRRRQPRIRIHHEPNAKHDSRLWRNFARLHRGQIPKAR